MGVQDILILLYVLTAAGSMWMTISERHATGVTNLFYGILAMLACAVWPLTLLTILAMSLREEQASLRQQSEI